MVRALFLLHVEAILLGLLVNLGVGQEGQLFGGVDISHVLHVALGEDDVDFFQRAVFGLGVEEPGTCQLRSVRGTRRGVNEPDDREEAGVDGGEEEIRAPFDVRNHDRSGLDMVSIACPEKSYGPFIYSP